MIVIRFFACWFALSVVAGVIAGRIIAAGAYRTAISPGSSPCQASAVEPATDVLPAPSQAPASALDEIARLESMFNQPAYRGRRQVEP